MDTRAIQAKLKTRGFSPGPIDGVLGPLTAAAVAAFQRAEGIDVHWPGTIGPKTLAALGLAGVALPWMAEAARFLGLHERRDAAALNRAMRLNAREVAWCGAFCALVFRNGLPGEPLPDNPLGARNWLKFGREAAGPQVGAVAVFWRGKRDGWQGHVGLVIGHDKTHVHVRGGNQQDAVTDARIAKNRLLGYRWPSTYDAPAGTLAMTTIAASVSTNEA